MIMDNNLQQRHQSQTNIVDDLAQSENSNYSNKCNNNNININNSEKPQIQKCQSLPFTGKSQLKRSFDVAFLMMPDERITQKQAEKKSNLAEIANLTNTTAIINDDDRYSLCYATDLSPRSQQQVPQGEADLYERRNYTQLCLRSPRIYDDPSVILPQHQTQQQQTIATDAGAHGPFKSAFTKVATRLESPIEILAPPLSPDQLSCPSMSPPVATTPPRTNSGNGSMSNGSSGHGSQTSCLPCLNPNIIYQSFRPEYQFNGAFQSVNQVQVLQAQRFKHQLLYRPSVANATNVNTAGVPTTSNSTDFLTISGYTGFPFPTVPHAFSNVSPPDLPRIVQNPAAAAILSTLIPPTLASTFTLTAQNVCAKCNISFRMTSDLVYHMRSHHKSEVTCDPNRRKREDKLKCPVCQESFRERHHLTRHMTAHQDKESDHHTVDGSCAVRDANSNRNELINGTSGIAHSMVLNNGRQHLSRIASGSK